MEATAIPATPRRVGWLFRGIGAALLALIVLILALMWWWDEEPERFEPVAVASRHAQAHGHRLVPGTTTTATFIHLIEVMLEKRGGYLANDITPPGVLMDNIPNWEKGVVLVLRDVAQSLRNDFSRSQSQSVEDVDLREAMNFINYKHTRWLLPSSESQFRNAAEKAEAYLTRLGDTDDENAQFYARADNLVAFLEHAGKRLGSMSQRLSASVGQLRINTDLAGEPAARQSTPARDERVIKTPWLEIDDVFYEARGSTYALLHVLKAVEHDFEPVLRDKNALISLRQVIRELEECQADLGSPIILNGSQYGFFANHSLVMANYVSRANAAMIDLRRLLERG